MISDCISIPEMKRIFVCLIRALNIVFRLSRSVNSKQKFSPIKDRPGKIFAGIQKDARC
jgi:hypothetical protein